MGLTKRHQDLLEARGLDVELLERLGVETSDRRSGDWVAIPYFDRGERVNAKYRTIAGHKEFEQDAGKKPIFWNLDCLRDESLASQPVIIAEGEFDAMAAIQAGFQRTVSVPNGAPSQETKDDSGTRYAFLQDARPLLRDCNEIILATDNDAPGIALMNDLCIRLGKARCKWVRYPVGCKDLNDALTRYGQRGVVETLNRAQWVKVTGVYRMSELPPIASPTPYPIGIQGLDRHYKIRMGDLAVIIGPPGHGKSTLLNEIAGRVAQDYGWVCAFGSFEQRPQHDHRRNLTTFHARKHEKWLADDERAAAAKWIDEQFVFIVPDDEDEPTILWLIERIQAAVVQYGAKVIIVDPWNELEHTRPDGMSETEYTGRSLAQLRRLAQRLQVHIIVATHPTKLERQCNGKLPVPTLYDASGSANWANKPDVGIIVYRDRDKTLIRVQKSRYDEIGEPGDLEAIYLKDQGRYEIITDLRSFGTAA